MRSGLRLLAVAVASAVCMMMLPTLAPGSSDEADKDIKPNGKRIGTLLNPGNGNGNANGQGKGSGGGGGTDNGIYYHGGPVMLGTVHVYYIWYGDWTGNSAKTILTDLANSIGTGASPSYFNINKTYTDSAGNHVSGLVQYVSSIDDNYSLGTNLTDSNIATIVSNAINSNQLPKDESGAYFVLTSADVSETSGFCTIYCGWHTYGTLPGTAIKYAFVGNAARCPSACAAQTTSPNDNTGADAMASVIAHELEEMITDPKLNAWYDRRGYENADKCAWTFGSVSLLPSGAYYNMTLGARNYLIQQNWVNAGGGYCAKSY